VHENFPKSSAEGLHIYRHQSTTIMPRPRAKKSNKATAPLHSSSREVTRMIRPSARVSHAGSSESSAEAYTNSRDPIDDSDSVAEILDQDSAFFYDSIYNRRDVPTTTPPRSLGLYGCLAHWIAAIGTSATEPASSKK